MRVRVKQYGRVSNSARLLARALGVRRLLYQNSRFRPRSTDLIINWGSRSRLEGETGERYINAPEAVAHAADKREAFARMEAHDVPVVPWTTDVLEAERWREDSDVVVRHKVSGHSSDGLEIVKKDSLDALPRAPLYTRYMKKNIEYRIHVVGGKVIDWTQKRRNKDISDEQVNWQVRSYRNGFVFCRGEGCTEPNEHIKAMAIRAVYSLGLDFGAVDIGYHSPSQTCHIYEVNTAPGIEATSVDRYAAAFKEMIEVTA